MINPKDVRCVMRDREKKIVKILYTDNTNSTFKNVDALSVVTLDELTGTNLMKE